MRIAIYARVSTRDKGQDTENQIIQLREFASKQGWEVVEEFIDEASGGTSDRAEFRRMFECASRREFNLLLFWSLDRFSREGALESLQHLRRLTDYGVGYRSFTEPYFDSCGIFGEVVISIQAVLAKQERIRLSERVIAGLKRYQEDFKREIIGKEKSSRSGKNFALKASACVRLHPNWASAWGPLAG